jgi:preprotein translocase subunit YajC
LSGEVPLVLAQAVPAEGGGGGFLNLVIFMVAMFLLLYALAIRPQQRQQREHRRLISQLKRGDQVVTSGGIHGKITGVSDEILTVEIAERVRGKISRSAVTTRVAAADEAKAVKESREAKEGKKS